MATHRRDIIAKAIEKHPKAQKQTLAKYLAEKFPHEFPSIENARNSIRYYTGSNGKRDRKKTVVIKGTGPSAPSTFKIPKGIKQNKKPLHIKDIGRYLVTPDWHVPYHDENALEAMFRFAFDAKCIGFIGLGDQLDFYKSSQWCKDPRGRDLLYERSKYHEIINECVVSNFKYRYQKIGNHEDRFTRRIWESTPELAVLPEFDIEKVIQVEDKGFTVISSTRFTKMNGLWLLHGHELAKGAFSPVNVARGIFLRTRQTACAGHWHRTSTHTETGGMSKKLITCYSIGCMCDLSPQYAPTNNWNHGFATVRLENDNYFFENFVVDRGKVYSQ